MAPKFIRSSYAQSGIAIKSGGESSAIGRPTCFSCLRPASHCVCGLIEPFEAPYNILILQHPHERKKYYSTAKLVRKGIINSQLLRGVEFDESQVEAALAGRQGFMLFPGPTALDCRQAKLDLDSVVIVIDGTWSEANKIIASNPFLLSLPCLTFSDSLQSNYRIRKQPRPGCLSTIESVAHLMRLTQPPQQLRGTMQPCDLLLNGFAKMVDQQLTHISPTERRV